MLKSLHLYAAFLAAFLTIAVLASYTDGDPEKMNQQNKITADALPQVIQSVDLTKPYSFAEEALPMDNFDVQERLDRELMVNSYWHSSTMLHIKKAARYFPIIEKILAENEVPDDLKYLAVAESSLSHVSSPVGAKGFWQFMHATGKEYGLEINSEVDERYHIEKSTEAACKYLKKYHQRFGSWSLAAAAYNMGGGKLKKEMETQRAKSYYDLNLNPETNRYVFRIVAIKEILSKPSDFGFYLEEEELYTPLSEYAVVEVTESVPNLGDFAIKYGTTYRMLKVYNPWLRASKLTVSSGNKYEIRIPK